MSLTNFLTYDSCTFFFNPKLNVIIGPNGTGKSSVVCGLCLGLAGKPNILSRAKDLVDFIKHGKDKAMIEIEIFNQPTSSVIRRDLTKVHHKCTSTWYHNKKTVTSKQIEEIVSKFNIQLSNLCQFLAQERVADFAKMNKIELLENTELAICPPQMLEDHIWLKNYRSSEKDLETKYADDKTNLEKLIQINNAVKREVMRYKEKAQLISDLKILDQKKCWTEYEQARQKYFEDKEKLSKLQKRMDEAKKQFAPLNKKREALTSKMDKIDDERKKKVS
jgi:chromosome segregation ATPase